MKKRTGAYLLSMITAGTLLMVSGTAMAGPKPGDVGQFAGQDIVALIAMNDDQVVGPYSYTIKYAGMYEAGRLYRKYHGAEEWRGQGEPAFLENVSCSSARSRLAKYGIWSGALQADGSCWNSEPQEYATGNYLNYLFPLREE